MALLRVLRAPEPHRRHAKFGSLIRPPRIRWIFEAWLLLWLCRCGLWLAPFRRVVQFARYCSARFPSSSALSTDELAESIGCALPPTLRATCLTQALAGWIMLSRRHIRAQIKIGVRDPRADVFGAHAWLEVEDRVVLGDVGLDSCHVIWTLAQEAD